MLLNNLVRPTVVIIHGRGRGGTICAQKKEKEIIRSWFPGRFLVEGPVIAGNNAGMGNKVIWPMLVGVDRPLPSRVGGEGPVVDKLSKPLLVEGVAGHVCRRASVHIDR